jgi:mono/diheme cytochrome c family protein
MTILFVRTGLLLPSGENGTFWQTRPAMSLRIFVLLAGLTAALAFEGCSRHVGASTSATATPDPAATGSNIARGKAIYERECQACHGVNGVHGPVGPALQGEHSRRSFSATEAIVLDPDPPMPKLYPSRLTKADVRDVTAYVESL